MPCPNAGGGDRHPNMEPEMERTERLDDATTTALDRRGRTSALGGDVPEAYARAVRPDLVLGRYRLERRLGAGGFGVVWLAYDVRLEREVAVKAIPHERDLEASAPRAQHEARAAARLNHPAIVALYELGGDDAYAYLVYELVHGCSLAELLDADVVSDRDIARLGASLCDALAHAHENGVIHRDVKPQNVIVAAQPAAGAGFAKLADFGAARFAGPERLTGTGEVIGTLAYMAPEQAEGRHVDGAADLYSLALTLYEGLCGENPVRERGIAATARRLGRPLPPLRSRRRDLPLDICDAIDRAVDPEPELRGTLAELANALDEAAAQLDEEGGLDTRETVERFGLAPRRRRGLGRRLTRAWWGQPEPLVREVAPVLVRTLAGGAAGGLVLLGLRALGSPALPVEPLGIAGAAALAVALLPRLGWLAAAAGLIAWAALSGSAGTALVLAAAVAPVPVLLPRSGPLWSLPAFAPVLGAVGLAPAFIALAGLAGRARQRVGLAVAGLLWLLAAELLSGERLLYGRAPGTAAQTAWSDSALAAAREALYPLATPALAAPLLVWVVSALLLPLCVRGRSPAYDLAGAAIWAAGVLVVHQATAEALAPWLAAMGARGAAGAVVAGALMAVVAAPILRRMALE